MKSPNLSPPPPLLPPTPSHGTFLTNISPANRLKALTTEIRTHSYKGSSVHGGEIAATGLKELADQQGVQGREL